MSNEQFYPKDASSWDHSETGTPLYRDPITKKISMREREGWELIMPSEPLIKEKQSATTLQEPNIIYYPYSIDLRDFVAIEDPNVTIYNLQEAQPKSKRVLHYTIY